MAGERGGQFVRGLLVVIAILPSIGFTWVPIAPYYDPPYLFIDANTYLAAGERLNAGHPLDTLLPGDRPVIWVPGTAPLLSPPPIAAIWRPIAALPLGYEAWVAACWLAVLGNVAYLILRGGLPVVLVAIAMSFAIGELLAGANVMSFSPDCSFSAGTTDQNPGSAQRSGPRERSHSHRSCFPAG